MTALKTSKKVPMTSRGQSIYKSLLTELCLASPPSGHARLLTTAKARVDQQQWEEALDALQRSKLLHLEGGIPRTPEEDDAWNILLQDALAGKKAQEKIPKQPVINQALVCEAQHQQTPDNEIPEASYYNNPPTQQPQGTHVQDTQGYGTNSQDFQEGV